MESDPELRKRYALTLRQIDQMVLLAPCDVGVRIELQKMSFAAGISAAQIKIGNALGIVRDILAKSEQEGKYHREHAIREQVDQMHRVFSRSDARRANQAMIRQAVPGWEKSRRPDNETIRVLEQNYRNIDVPCLIIWGECDDTLPEWMGHKIKDHITGSILEELPGCKHSAALECPQLCADLVREFHARSTSSLIAATPVSAVGSVRRFSH